jgi:ADP-heptose:LPS heptosyltransferase
MTAPHVLAVRLDNLGDVLLQGPAVRAIANGASRVTFLTSRAGAAAAQLLPGVDEVLAYECPWIAYPAPAYDAAEHLELVERIAGLACDRAVIFTSLHQSALPTAMLLRMAGIEHVSAISPEYPGALLDVRHHVNEEIHEVERGLSLASSAGFELPAGDDGSLSMRLPARPPDDWTSRGSWVGERPRAVVHPGASVPARTWAPARWAAVVDTLVARGWDVRVTGSAAEHELAARVAHDVAENLAGTTDLAEFARIIRYADVLLTGNTGPAHIAAAMKTPVVEVFPPTISLARWRPWRVAHEILGDQTVACAGCRAKTCPHPGQPCLESIGVADVIEAAEKLAEHSQLSTPSPAFVRAAERAARLVERAAVSCAF